VATVRTHRQPILTHFGPKRCFDRFFAVRTEGITQVVEVSAKRPLRIRLVGDRVDLCGPRKWIVAVRTQTESIGTQLATKRS